MSTSICRICLCRGEYLTSLFHCIKGISLGDKIMSCTSVHIDYDDQLPSKICCKCVDRVNDSYDFKILCEDSDLILRKRLSDNKSLLDFDDSILVKNEQNVDADDDDFLPVKCELKYDHSDNENSKSKYKIRNEYDQMENSNKRIGMQLNEEMSSENIFSPKKTNRFTNKIADASDEKEDDIENQSDECAYSSYCPSDDELPLSEHSKLVRKRLSDKHEKKHSKNKIDIKEKKSRNKSKIEKGSWKLKCECATCGRVLSNKYSLELHMRTHTGEKPYKCSHCDKSFALLKTVRCHERIHTGEKPLLCSDCGKSFASHSTLNSHRKSHKNERPFKCTLCPSTYRRRAHLDFHMKIHLGEKTYKCHLCDKAFVTKDYLKSHLLWHSGERNFICNVCGKKMTRSHHLKLHMMTHTGDRPYKCEICDISFIQKGYWMKHLNKHKTNQPIKQRCTERSADIVEKLEEAMDSSKF